MGTCGEQKLKKTESNTKENKKEETNNINNENIKTENLQTENLQKENLQKENLQKENLQKENLQTENLQTENLQTENTKSENIKTENRKTDIKTENIKSENIKSENLNTEIIKTENIKTEPTEFSEGKIKIIFKYENEIIYKNYYNRETKINKIINDFLFLKEKNDDYTYIFNNEIKYVLDNKKEIEEEDILKNILLNNEDITLNININFCGLKNIPFNIDKYIYDRLEVIGKPIKLDRFLIFNFYKETNSLKQLILENENIEESEIKYFSSISSFCNGLNKLYIYGGEKNEKEIGIFWTIDLLNNKINQIKPKEKLQPLIFHSLIFIPKKYIFIIGGENNNKTFYFDTEKEKFIFFSEIKENLIEPSLIFINNKYLYAISNIKKMKIIRANLREENKWENINILIPENINFSQKFFAICKYNKNKIFFIGGGSLNKKQYIFQYNFNKNQIFQSKTILTEFDFIEKTFIPLNNIYYVILPNIQKGIFKMILFNKLKGIIEIVRFEFDNNVKSSSIVKFFPNKKKNVNEIDLNMPNPTKLIIDKCCNFDELYTKLFNDDYKKKKNDKNNNNNNNNQENQFFIFNNEYISTKKKK
jgi:hypothetical protein